MQQVEHVDTVIIGGGQAGLAVGYFLQRQNRSFVILEANARIGDSWRKRWPSLRLYSPARIDGLPGMRFPAPPNSFPTGNEMADYLEAYAARFELPVHTGTPVDGVERDGGSYVVTAAGRRVEAKAIRCFSTRPIESGRRGDLLRRMPVAVLHDGGEVLLNLSTTPDWADFYARQAAAWMGLPYEQAIR